MNRPPGAAERPASDVRAKGTASSVKQLPPPPVVTGDEVVDLVLHRAGQQLDDRVRDVPPEDATALVQEITGMRPLPPVASLSITELLSAAGEGNPVAWEEIIRRYGGLVRAKVRGFRLQAADALDAIQMTWLRLAENCHRIQLPEHLGGWLATTASRECLRILHQATRTPHAAEAVTDSVTDSSIGPEQHAIDTDTAQQLWNLVAELPPRGRSLLQALFTDNPLPYTEVAHITGISIGSIGPTRARALQQLRRMADERGLGQAILHEHSPATGDCEASRAATPELKSPPRPPFDPVRINQHDETDLDAEIKLLHNVSRAFAN